MKYLYILINSETGFYAEQTYISMLSLKRVSPNAHISLLVDKDTAQITRNSFFEKITNIANEYKVIELDKAMPPVAKSRFLKTTMRQHIDGDFIYIDSDTIWVNPIEEADFTFDIMAVLDGHVLFNQNPAKEKIENLFKKLNCQPNTEFYVNGGVLFSRDTDFSRSFFTQWHEKWNQTSQTGIFIDQPSLNYTINKTIVPNKNYLLPGEYNCQIANSWNHFFNSKIVHYFTSGYADNNSFHSPYLLQQQNFWQNFREKHTQLDMSEIICNPLGLFENDILIKNATERDFEKTKLYGWIQDLYIRKKTGKKSRFDLLEKMLSLFG